MCKRIFLIISNLKFIFALIYALSTITLFKILIFELRGNSDFFSLPNQFIKTNDKILDSNLQDDKINDLLAERKKAKEENTDEFVKVILDKVPSVEIPLYNPNYFPKKDINSIDEEIDN